MPATTHTSTPRALGLSFGFATAVAMWAVGFALRLPPATTPSALILFGMLALLIAGGAAAGRAGGVAAGVWTGSVASLINLLVLGSLISGDQPNALQPSALIWIPGSLALGAGLGALGGFLASRGRRAFTPADPTFVLAFVAAAATFVLILIGGLVTSHEAGLAVVDWPNSYQYNMFLFPLAKMTGGIYYEHAHRLFGSLVGLTTVALALRVFATDSRGVVKIAAALAVLFVIGQGVLGGLRVTGHFTMSDSPEITRPSLLLAMVHGTTGQLFFGWMVGLAAAVSPRWKRRDSSPGPAGGVDHLLTGLLLLAVIGQLVLGVRLRHLEAGALIHITVGVTLVLFTTLIGVRMVAKHEDIPILKNAGLRLTIAVWAQMMLGFLAYVFVGRAATPGLADVLTATLHQSFGALVLAQTVLAFVWSRRLLPAAGAAPALGPSPTS